VKGPDVDRLPPTQYLILEVLAARCRLGEQLWPFPTRLRAQLAALTTAGLVDTRSGPVAGSMQAWLTDAGRAVMLAADYVPPLDLTPCPGCGFSSHGVTAGCVDCFRRYPAHYAARADSERG
jgi:hypothetical protein